VCPRATPPSSRDKACSATGHALGVKHDGGYAEYARLPGGLGACVAAGHHRLDAMALGRPASPPPLPSCAWTQTALPEERRGDRRRLTGASARSPSRPWRASIRGGRAHRQESEADFLRGSARRGQAARRAGSKKDPTTGPGDLRRRRRQPGRRVLSWMLSSMKFGGTVAAIGLAASPALKPP